MIQTQLIWNPARLDAALLSAFRRSLPIAERDATTHSPSSKAGARISRVNATSLAAASATLSPTGLGFVFESGRQGGYPIYPGGVKGYRRSRAKTAVTFDLSGRGYTFRSRRGGEDTALKFPNGQFAAYATGGAMRAKPYVRPAAARWATTGYKTAARATLASQGFR